MLQPHTGLGRVRKERVAHFISHRNSFRKEWVHDDGGRHDCLSARDEECVVRGVIFRLGVEIGAIVAVLLRVDRVRLRTGRR